ncbi:MAG: hypothetical protein KGH64_06585 [Candidatus Micrarchaeota archaeon]|nr:hypothetical protein [Candidatus Micrarchaeota archaeon]MDE1859198.1 hypothetical protein [Candidatus Micrarchaeota archaeon]
MTTNKIPGERSRNEVSLKSRRGRPKNKFVQLMAFTFSRSERTIERWIKYYDAIPESEYQNPDCYALNYKMQKWGGGYHINQIYDKEHWITYFRFRDVDTLLREYVTIKRHNIKDGQHVVKIRELCDKITTVASAILARQAEDNKKNPFYNMDPDEAVAKINGMLGGGMV